MIGDTRFIAPHLEYRRKSPRNPRMLEFGGHDEFLDVTVAGLKVRRRQVASRERHDSPGKRA